MQRKGVKDPLRPCGPSLHPLQGPVVRLVVAARAVIGPLTKTRRRTINVHDVHGQMEWLLLHRNTNNLHASYL